MTIRGLSLSWALRTALLAAVMVFPFAIAHAQMSAPTKGGQRAYWCKSPNGVAALQTESCAPGTEVSSEPVGPHGKVAPRQVQSMVVPNAPAAAEPSAGGRSAPAAQAASASPGYVPGPNALKRGLLSILKLLGFGLLVGLIARSLGRPFWRWAGFGCLLWIGLALVRLVTF